ncbi:hypothetical protein SAMN05661080_01450 [Modestobacter sp. DSM 44400]|uniref:hypothetical protein n=1 Tax=Modestobacter sp. DSM 44400 TaxID=1550230 RepID=UPI0008969584|nr:hypothetical protein [Modestobacter sp. DSM 44400]SDX84816.1 hypothetical protein SAMN05661080_01450 [Modestobacter sp. DSM 44400]
MMRRFRARYGAHPLHLLTMLASLALAGYAALKLVPANPLGIAVWFIGAAIAHDLLLLPLYSVVDSGLVHAWRRRGAPELPQAPWINYLRVPLALSAVLLLLYAPLILQFAGHRYAVTTSMSTDPYLEHWLLITAALFGLSALGYAVRLRRSRRQHARPSG